MPELLREQSNAAKPPIDASIDDLRGSKPNARIIDLLKLKYHDSYQHERLVYNAVKTLTTDQDIAVFLGEYIDMRCKEKHLLDGCRNGYLNDFKRPADEILKLLTKHSNEEPIRERWTKILGDVMDYKTYELQKQLLRQL